MIIKDFLKQYHIQAYEKMPDIDKTNKPHFSIVQTEISEHVKITVLSQVRDILEVDCDEDGCCKTEIIACTKDQFHTMLLIFKELESTDKMEILEWLANKKVNDLS